MFYILLIVMKSVLLTTQPVDTNEAPQIGSCLFVQCCGSSRDLALPKPLVPFVIHVLIIASSTPWTFVHFVYGAPRNTLRVVSFERSLFKERPRCAITVTGVCTTSVPLRYVSHFRSRSGSRFCSKKGHILAPDVLQSRITVRVRWFRLCLCKPVL